MWLSFKCILACLLINMEVSMTRCQPVFYKRTKGAASSCAMLKISVLMTLHGGAFNERYMSIRTPKITNQKGQGAIVSLKRAAIMPENNSTAPSSSSTVESAEAWDIDPVSSGEHSQLAWEAMRPFDINRLKRGRDRVKAPWDCGETVEWVDLGVDHFPRYLRSVKCLCETCWYNTYQCKPRTFPINVLRKRSDECVEVPEKYHKVLEVRSGDQVEAWLWQEQSINVSCECVWSPK